MSETAEILKAARDLIDKPENWTQGAFARDGKGRSESISRASCFCIIGAIAKVARTNLGSPVPQPVGRFCAATWSWAYCDKKNSESMQ